MRHTGFCGLVAVWAIGGLFSSVQAGSWSSWRGDAAGTGKSGASAADLPLEWSPEKNVRWRTPLPDRGNSTPIVVGGRVFVNQAEDADHSRSLRCFDRKTGEMLWKRGVTYKNPERTHRTNPYCSASPVSDGERVVVSFGSAGLACYDLEGKELWKRELGPIDHVWGNSSSPVIHGDLCLHYHGPSEKGAILIALNLATGKTVWKFDEPGWTTGERTDGFRGRSDEGVIGSFSTPILVQTGGRAELIMSFPMEIRSFDPASGREFWRCGGLNPLVYSSPVYGDGVVVAMGGYQGNSVAVRTGGEGDVTESHRLWHEVRHDGGIGSGVIEGGHLYYHNSSGIASCLDLRTGKEQWKARLPGRSKSWGSFVLAGDRIYSFGQPGEAIVFRANPEKLEVLARNDLKELTNASPVISDGEIFIRTHEALWCIGSGE